MTGVTLAIVVTVVTVMTLEALGISGGVVTIGKIWSVVIVEIVVTVIQS